MQPERKRRIGLGTKLNAVLTVSILVISLGLLMVTYRVYCRKVDSLYYERVERAATGVAGHFVPDRFVSHFRRMFGSDDFREVYARAKAAGDEKILEDWMRTQPPVDYELAYYEENKDELTDEEKEEYTLFADYSVVLDWFREAKAIFDVTSVYIQYVEDGVTYNLADPDESLFLIGTAEEPIPAFARYPGNDRIPPTIYRFGNDWLCTACEPITEEIDGVVHVVGQIGADIDMNDVLEERRWFILNSAVFVTAITLASIAAGMLLTRKLATKPLKMLAAGAMDFAKADAGFSMDDVIRLPIRSNDEIGDLYREIRSMQERIVDGADQLTRITADRERVSTELRMAAEIQSAMLPRIFPAFPDRPEFDLYASMVPAKEVGGDFYDFFLLDDDHLALVIADVSDKGVPAALFMMSAKIIISYRAQMGGTPGEILTSVNAQLCRDNAYRMFVTVWLGILELSTGRLTCTNAGHEYPAVRRPGGEFRLFRDPHGIFVGVMKKAAYRDYELLLEPGSKLFLYTDGLPEAIDGDREQFGTDRLLAALNDDPDAPPRALLTNVSGAVDAFVRDARQFDDLTMLCLEYRGPGGARKADEGGAEA